MLTQNDRQNLGTICSQIVAGNLCNLCVLKLRIYNLIYYIRSQIVRKLELKIILIKPYSSKQSGHLQETTYAFCSLSLTRVCCDHQ